MDNQKAIELLKHHIETWEGKFPSGHFEACRVAIEALQKNDEIRFSITFFNDLFELCEIVYREKPEVNSFSEYVEGLILKDLKKLD